jgi:ABC-2 type transport system ATP-binding protein
MDEPTDGLDPNQKHEVRNLIRLLAEGGGGGGASGGDRGSGGSGGNGGGGRAIILSTHILEEVEAVCTRAVVIAKGKIVADDTPRGLAARSRLHNAVSLTVVIRDGRAQALPEALAALPGVAAVEGVQVEAAPPSADRPGGSARVRCTVIPKPGAALQTEISRLMEARGWRVESMRLEAGRLDDVFRDLTTGRAAGGDGRIE